MEATYDSMYFINSRDLFGIQNSIDNTSVTGSRDFYQAFFFEFDYQGLIIEYLVVF